jgi:hypothetical protein
LRSVHLVTARSSVRDVLICPNTETDHEDEDFDKHPPVAFPFSGLDERVSPVELGRGARVDRLSYEEQELVMHACSPRGHYFLAVRQFAQRYSLVRDVDPAEAEARLTWDPDQVLRHAMQLSRLVRDNNDSTEWAARITNYEDGQQMVMPLLSPHNFVYRLRRDRDWLDEQEALELRNVLAVFWAAEGTLPARVTEAMWRTEYAGWSPWAEAFAGPCVAGEAAARRCVAELACNPRLPGGLGG